jgi:hypothetical protein
MDGFLLCDLELHVVADLEALDVRKVYISKQRLDGLQHVTWPLRAENTKPHFTDWSTHPVPAKLGRVLISHELSRRSWWCLYPDLATRAAQLRKAQVYAGSDWLPHAEDPPESLLKILCTDPGRLKFQIDTPSAQIRERLRADAEIYCLVKFGHRSQALGDCATRVERSLNLSSACCSHYLLLCISLHTGWAASSEFAKVRYEEKRAGQ